MSHTCPTITGSNDDPQFRHDRSQLAAKRRHSVDTYVKSIVRRAPELTEDHRAALRSLLASQDGGAQ